MIRINLGQNKHHVALCSKDLFQYGQSGCVVYLFIYRDALVVAKRIAIIILPYRNRATRLKKNGSKRIWTYLLLQGRPILGTRVVIFG